MTKTLTTLVLFFLMTALQAKSANSPNGLLSVSEKGKTWVVYYKNQPILEICSIGFLVLLPGNLPMRSFR